MHTQVEDIHFNALIERETKLRERERERARDIRYILKGWITSTKKTRQLRIKMEKGKREKTRKRE